MVSCCFLWPRHQSVSSAARAAGEQSGATLMDGTQKVYVDGQPSNPSCGKTVQHLVRAKTAEELSLSKHTVDMQLVLLPLY